MKGITTVKKIVQGGYGLAFHKGFTVFIPYTAPGDRVEFTAKKKKRNTLFARLEEVLEPSEMRISPQCPNFGKCGGCDLLHIDYPFEIETKKMMVRETLSRIGDIETDFSGVISSPRRYGYRNSCVFRISTSWRPGFLEAESSRVVEFPPQGCLLLPDIMREAIASIPKDSIPDSGQVMARTDKFGNVHFWGLAGIATPPDALMEAGGFLFPVKPDGFFQVNRFLNDGLIDLVCSLTRKKKGKVLDLYSGAGFFTLALASKGFEVTGIEGNMDSYSSAVAAARLNDIQGVKFRRGSVESEIARTGKADLIVADPPRSGMTRKVIDSIAGKNPEELILVSCDPPTLARDLSRLAKKGYEVKEVYLVDMFPATAHTETVALATR